MRFISRVLPHLRRARPQIRYASSAGGISTMAVGSVVALGGVAGAAIYYAMAGGPNADEAGLREAIRNIMDSDDWDDGSLGPILVRLAWHASGTYCCTNKNGGSCGATMRYKQEASDDANAGLEKARAFLEPIKAQFPEVSYADLWILAGYVAIEEMGGPAVPFRFGRPDAPTENETSKKLEVPPNGRLPDASLGAQHVRDVFYRMGFNDREIVALVGGGHALGRCHTDRSGFDGPWTFAPTTFSNEYFRLLFEEKWTRKNWSGPTQFEDSSGALMMLPTDMANLTDPEFRKYSEMYMKDYATFESDFAAAWKKLTELGM